MSHRFRLSRGATIAVRASPLSHSRKDHTMRRFRNKVTIAVTAAAALALAVGPASAGAKNEDNYRTVKGYATGTDSVNVQTLDITADARGDLSHLGDTTAHFAVDADRTQEGTVAGTGDFTLAAANGNELTGTFTLAGPAPSLGAHEVRLVLDVNGGSGRFADADGELRTTQQVTPRSLVNGILHQDSEGPIAGRISY